MKKLVLLTVALAFSSIAAADITYSCKHGNQERIISVVYPEGGNSVPCEVRYQKGDNVQTLWNAQNEVGYCEARAEEFVEKQKGWGWNCSQVEQ